MKHIIIALAALLLTPLALLHAAEGKAQPTAIFTQTSDALHRIPSLVIANDGSVLAFASCRKGTGPLGDFGHDTDVVLRRSEDGGDSFGPVTTLMTKLGTDIHHGPALVDRQSGRVFKFGKYWPVSTGYKASMQAIDAMPYAKMMADGWVDHVVSSSDHGKTWSPPKPVNLDFPPDALRCGTGNGNHGIQLRNGRLLIQAGHLTAWPGSPGAFQMHLGTFYSDDHGTTWTRGISVPHQQVREFAMIEQPDGSLLFSIRATPRAANSQFNATPKKISGGQMLAVSADRGQSITSSRLDTGLPYGDSNTGMVILNDGSAHGIIIHSSPTEKRSKLGLHTSADGGRSWRLARAVAWDGVGYSDLALSPDGKSLHCLFEGKGKNSSRGIFHLRLPITSLK